MGKEFEIVYVRRGSRPPDGYRDGGHFIGCHHGYYADGIAVREVSECERVMKDVKLKELKHD